MKIKQYQKRRLTRLQLSFPTITIPPFPAGATKPLKNNSVTNRNATPRAQEQSKRHFHIFIRFSIGCHATEHGSADRGSFRASLQRSARAPKELDGAANAPYRAGRSDYGLTALNAESLLSVIRSLKGSGSSKRTCNTPPASFYLPLLLFLSLFLSLSPALTRFRERQTRCQWCVFRFVPSLVRIVPLECRTMRTPQSSRLFTLRDAATLYRVLFPTP